MEEILTVVVVFFIRPDNRVANIYFSSLRVSKDLFQKPPEKWGCHVLDVSQFFRFPIVARERTP